MRRARSTVAPPVATVATVALAVIAGAAPAAAKGKARPKPPPLAVYDDARAGIRFSYPKAWRNITVADDAAKVEARSDDGVSRLTIDAVPRPAEGGVVGLLEQRVPGGSVGGGAGEWKCIEGDVEGGTRHAALCGKRQKDDVVIVALHASTGFLAPGDWTPLVLKLAAASSGLKAPHDD